MFRALHGMSLLLLFPSQFMRLISKVVMVFGWAIAQATIMIFVT